MKIIKRIIIMLIWLILILILSLNIYNYISKNILKDELPTVGGYAVLEVVSGSMNPTIKVGDLVVINTKEKNYKVNDIITFKDEKDSFVTHRIVEINEEGIVTKGDNNDSLDEGYLDEERIVGIYKNKIANLGNIVRAFKNPVTIVLIFIIGIIVCVLVSTDKDGNPIDITEDDKEFLEYIKNKNKNKKEKLEKQETKDKKTTKEKTGKKENKNKKSPTKKNK